MARPNKVGKETKPWTKDEYDFLKQNYLQYSNSDLADLMDRSPSSIQSKLRNLHLRRGTKCDIFTLNKSYIVKDRIGKISKDKSSFDIEEEKLLRKLLEDQDQEEKEMSKSINERNVKNIAQYLMEIKDSITIGDLTDELIELDYKFDDKELNELVNDLYYKSINDNYKWEKINLKSCEPKYKLVKNTDKTSLEDFSLRDIMGLYVSGKIEFKYTENEDLSGLSKEDHDKRLLEYFNPILDSPKPFYVKQKRIVKKYKYEIVGLCLCDDNSGNKKDDLIPYVTQDHYLSDTEAYQHGLKSFGEGWGIKNLTKLENSGIIVEIED